MSKQDAYSPRTAADLERKYNFGQTFAKVFGLVDDAVRTAEEAKTAYEGLDQEQIFNLLTNYGKAEGIYRDDNGEVYVNASYIKSGKLAAAYIETEGLSIKAANVVGLEDLLEPYEDAVEQYANQVAGFRADVNGFGMAVVGYENAVADYASELSLLNSSVKAYQGEVARYAAQVTTFQATVDGFSATVQGYGKDVSGYADALAGLNAQVKTYTSAVQGYEDDVENYAAQVTSFQQTVNWFNQTVIGYKETVDGYTAEYSAFNQTAESITATVGSLETSMSQTLRIASDGVTITNADGDTLEIDGGQIKASSITADQIDVDGLYVTELYSEGFSYYQYVSISGGAIDFYSGHIRDDSWGTLWMHAYTLAFSTEDEIRLYVPNGNYFAFTNGDLSYYNGYTGEIISTAVFK